ncbi:MAG: FxLYD domain-containing protein [Candidatus Bathyarchaeia archaeon]
MKKTVASLVLFILVLGAFASLAAPHVKAQTTQATLGENYSWYVAPSNAPIALSSGDLIVVGEVQNTGTVPLGTISISGVSYNSTSENSTTEVCPAFCRLIGVPALLPGQKAPFYMDFSPLENGVELDSNWASSVTNVTLYLGAALNTTQTQYSDLTIPAGSVNHYDNSGTYTVTGQVQNNGTQTIGDVWVLVTYYNSAGTVVAMNCTDFLDPAGSNYALSPGNSVTFTATPVDNNAQMSSEITSYSLLVESSPYTGSTTAQPTAEATASPTPASSSSAGTQTTATPANSLLTYGAVAAVVIVVAALIALTMMRSRRKSSPSAPLPPPPPPPPPP